MANGKTWWCGYLPAATHRTLLSKYLQSQAARVICLDRTCTHTSTHTLSPLIRVTDLIASPKVINRIYVKKKNYKKTTTIFTVVQSALVQQQILSLPIP